LCQHPGCCTENGQRMTNYDSSTPFGTVNFSQALINSINSSFCEMGKKLGPEVILDYARRFGFYKDPPIDLPSGGGAPSGLYQGGELLPRSQEGRADPGRLAFGQDRMLVTPLQMAMVAGGVANKGVVMEPYLTDRIRKPDGSVLVKLKPKELRRAVKSEVADEIASMMEGVVTSGTGTSAQIPDVRVAGKTGTAETGRSGRNTTWFISFAPVDNPRYAVAVVLQNQSGTGGSTAAPIAKEILQALMRSPSKRTSYPGAVSDTLIGIMFGGRYRILRKLGSGGMANVYLAEDEELGRRVAIKILNDRHANDDQFVERFRREAKNAAGLSHPNIVSIYDRGEAEGTYYIAMEYLEGRSLKELILSEGPLPIASAIEIARQILRAVGFAHRRQIVHRDIKPHNVLLVQDGPGDGDDRFKVTDFGISRTATS